MTTQASTLSTNIISCPDILGDKEIRHFLKLRLARSIPAPRAILEELRVHNGNAIADIVTIHNDSHCYEIKSDKDSVERVQRQAQFYDVAFRRVTLVTTARHLERALIFAPSHWGILIAKATQGRVVFTHVRSARLNERFTKQLALLTLWRSELATLAEPIAVSSLAKLSRKTLAELLSESLSTAKVSQEIGRQLVSRSQNLKSLHI